MKKIILTLIIMTTLTSATIAQNKEEKEVASAVEALRTAMVEANRQGLENAAAEELSYGHSGGHVEGKAEFVDKIANKKSVFLSISITNQTIKIVGDNAIVRHDLSAETNDGGKPGNVSLHILYVWKKEHGHWKMIARQAVKVKHD